MNVHHGASISNQATDRNLGTAWACPCILGHAQFQPDWGHSSRTVISSHKLIGLCLGKPKFAAWASPGGAHSGPDRADLGGARSGSAWAPTMLPHSPSSVLGLARSGPRRANTRRCLASLFHTPTNGGGLPKLCPSKITWASPGRT